MKKRFKWEPPALMALVLLLGVWLVWNQKNQLTGIVQVPGARYVEFRIGNARGLLEVVETGSLVDPPKGGVASNTDPLRTEFRVLLRNGHRSDVMDENQFRAAYGNQVLEDVTRRTDNFFFRLFNITTWSSLAWVLLGLGGQIAFSGRMVLQWIVSEKERRSVVPAAFWWLSLAGGAALFVYFVWRQDFVGVLGQSSGLVIYARNIRLIYKQRRRAIEATEQPAGGT
jgi:lipid-A-disaccharide synthase-like uncharacterized protein